MTGEKLLPCWHCGGEVAIALHSNEFDEYWWTVQRGYDDATACKCRLFMESDKFCLDVEEGEQAKDSPWAMELRARLVERWNTRAAVTDHDFAMAVHDGRLWVRVVKPTWSESDKYRCECGEQLRGFRHRCPACGGWVDYDGVGPKAVLG